MKTFTKFIESEMPNNLIMIEIQGFVGNPISIEYTQIQDVTITNLEGGRIDGTYGNEMRFKKSGEHYVGKVFNGKKFTKKMFRVDSFNKLSVIFAATKGNRGMIIGSVLCTLEQKEEMEKQLKNKCFAAIDEYLRLLNITQQSLKQ